MGGGEDGWGGLFGHLFLCGTLGGWLRFVRYRRFCDDLIWMVVLLAGFLDELFLEGKFAPRLWWGRLDEIDLKSPHNDLN